MNDNYTLRTTLRESLVCEMASALALPQTERTRAVLRALAGKAIQRFVAVAAELDCVVGKEGIAGGARWLLPRFVKSHSAEGVENIPPTGPLVIASNHPAFVDSVVISAYVPRRDYKVIIGEIPFFQHLPNIRQNAIFAPGLTDALGRMQAIRDVIRHLKQGGAILIFPRGSIEPDPAWMPAPDAEFDQWSRSLEIFFKSVPQTQVLVTIVRGVISKRAMQHPLTWFRKARPDRQRLAFMYQFARQMISGSEVFGLTPRVTFGKLIGARDGMVTARILQEVTRAAREILRTPKVYV